MRAFITEYQNLTTSDSKAAELSRAFQTAAYIKLNIRDLKVIESRHAIRRNRVIIVFKDKGLFQGRIGSKKFIEAQKQLVDTFIPNQAHKDGRSESDYIGICFDGMHLAYVSKELNGSIRVSDIQSFNEHSTKSLLLFLDQDNPIELTPQNVVNDFGPDSQIAHKLLGALWKDLDSLLTAKVRRVTMLYEEWISLFEQGTSLGAIGKLHLSAYLTSIGLPSDANLTRVLFVLHTYHALFFKLLAAEVVFVNNLVPQARASYCMSAAAMNDETLKESLDEDIENSYLFQQMGIFNFVEGSFFRWYLVNPSAELMSAIRVLLQQLNLYRLNELQLTHTRDVVKRVYQQLVPIALRHNIGEYFTPEWLVEFTMNRAGYQGPKILDQKYLDPCCGSGNFLIHAIYRYKEQAHAAGWDKKKTLQGIIDHIFGFDLNPVAVLTARVNYLIAIADLITTGSQFEIPIYQADAIYAPTVSDSANDVNVIRTYNISTRIQVVDFKLPEALIVKKGLFARVIQIMELCIKENYTESFFLARLNAVREYHPELDLETWKPFLLDMFIRLKSYRSRIEIVYVPHCT